MKRTKVDKQFMIQFDILNRDYLTNISVFLLTFCISMVSLFIAVIALIISLEGITSYSIGTTIFFGILIILFSVFVSRKIKKIIDNSRKLNAQAQKILFEIYPEYKEKFH